MKKKIIYIGGFELPDKNAAALRVLANSKILKSLGYDVILIGITKCENTIVRKSYEDFDSWSIPYPKNNIELLTYISSIKLYKSIIQNYDLGNVDSVISYNQPALVMRKLTRYFKKTHVKYISDTTEWYSSNKDSFFKSVLKKIDTSLRMNYYNKLCDGLITTSYYLTKFYRNMLVVELPTLFDLKLNKLVLKRNDKLIFTYAGIPFDNDFPIKKRNLIKDRLDLLIDLFLKLEDLNKKFYFNIYGIDLKIFTKLYPEKSEKLKMSSSIIFHGKVDNSVIKDKIKESNFTIFLRNPDRTTLAGFPTKFSESISLGTPVICNDLMNLKTHMHESINSFTIDLFNLNNQIKKMEFIFSLKNENYINMKKNCFNSKQFSYMNYKDLLSNFMKKIEKK